MPVDQLTFDEYVLPDASIERAIRRLNALAAVTPKRWQLFRQGRDFARNRALMKRADAECARSDGCSIAGIVAKSKNGDAAAMEALIERYQPRVAGFVFACVGDRQAIDDLCQTIFYKMLLRLQRLEDDEKFEAWLFRIARNACFDYFRRRRLRRIFVPWKSADEQFVSTEQPMPASTDDRHFDAFRRALMMLPKKQRELVALLQDDRLSYEQLAEITNSSVSSVKSRLFRARRQLRKYVHDEH